MKVEVSHRFVGTGTPSHEHTKDHLHLFIRILATLLRLMKGNVYYDVVGCTSIVAEEKTIQWSWLKIMSANDVWSCSKSGSCGCHAYEIIENKWVREMPIIRSV